MSANTYWRPKDKGTSLPCLSSFLDVVAEAQGFGHAAHETVLTDSDVPLLRGIAAADKSTRATVDQLLDAIEKHGTIILWREY
jgi:hypothetical protein